MSFSNATRGASRGGTASLDHPGALARGAHARAAIPIRSKHGLATAPRAPRSPSTINVLSGPKIEIPHARMAED
eukprot:6459873-Pyramimonas_sp.AAC.1